MATEPVPCSLRAATAEVGVPRAPALQQEKPLQWEPHAAHLESNLFSLQLKKSLHTVTEAQHSQK